ncbi:MAG: gliding motility-associated C-terminal domain-containing protein [Chitinophagales bacterium]|nr:gliding motility-associated C-terminal domain-containing protein [Chitinophagales bacterium]
MKSTILSNSFVVATSVLTLFFTNAGSAQILGNEKLATNNGAFKTFENKLIEKDAKINEVTAAKALTSIMSDEEDTDERTAFLKKDEQNDASVNAPGRTAYHDILIPTLLTPNGDGNNDILYVNGASLSNFRFSVYNMNGQIVFNTTQQSEGWNGTISGSLAPVGTYIYSVSGFLEDDSRVSKNSTFALSR